MTPAANSELDSVDREIRRAAYCLTADTPRSANLCTAAVIAYRRGDLLTDVWYPADGGWVIVRADDSGEFRREPPDGAPRGSSQGLEEERPLSDHVVALLRHRSSLAAPSPEMQQWTDSFLETLREDHFLIWFPSMLRTALDASDAHSLSSHMWTLVREIAVEQHANALLDGASTAPALFLAEVSELTSRDFANSLFDALVQRTSWHWGGHQPNPTWVVDFAARRVTDGGYSDAVEQASKALLDLGERLKEEALEAGTVEDHGYFLHQASGVFLAAHAGARAGIDIGIDAGAVHRMRRLATVADERAVTASTAVAHWFMDHDGELTRSAMAALKRLRAERDKAAVSRFRLRWIEQLWFSPRAIMDSDRVDEHCADSV